MQTLFQDANNDEQLLTVEEFSNLCAISPNNNIRIFKAYRADHIGGEPTRVIIFYHGECPAEME